jgi:hypothetical protein
MLLGQEAGGGEEAIIERIRGIIVSRNLYKQGFTDFNFLI